MVRVLGFPVRGCPSSRDALQFLREYPRRVGLLLADLALARMYGGELMERATPRSRVPVVLVVSRFDPHVDDLLGSYRDLPFLAKPVPFADLAVTLRDVLGQSPIPSIDPLVVPPSRRRRTSGHHPV